MGTQLSSLESISTTRLRRCWLRCVPPRRASKEAAAREAIHTGLVELFLWAPMHTAIRGASDPALLRSILKPVVAVAATGGVLLLPCSAPAEELVENRFPYPESHSVPGDTPGVTLDDDRGGLSFNPYTNDVFGHTDKINTHSLGAAFSGKREQFTYRTSWHWRLITPIYKTTRSSRYLTEPVGRYADWMEVRQSLLFPAQSSAYLQLDLSFSHIGPKGGRELQNTAHAIRGLGQYGWENPARMSRLDGGGEVGWAGKALGSVPLRVGIGYANNFLVEETYAMVSSQTHLLRSGQSTDRPSPFALYGSFRVAQIMGSSYAPVRPFRTAGVLKFVLWSFWQPSVSVSSAFVQGDTAPQMHVSPFDFFLAF